MLVPKLDGGRTRPMTLWVDAVMFVDTQLVIAEDSMEARGMSAILSQLWPQFGQILGSASINTVCSANKEFCTFSNRGFALCAVVQVQVWSEAD